MSVSLCLIYFPCFCLVSFHRLDKYLLQYGLFDMLVILWLTDLSLSHLFISCIIASDHSSNNKLLMWWLLLSLLLNISYVLVNVLLVDWALVVCCLLLWCGFDCFWLNKLLLPLPLMFTTSAFTLDKSVDSSLQNLYRVLSSSLKRIVSW